jgi:hypothetical protein
MTSSLRRSTTSSRASPSHRRGTLFGQNRAAPRIAGEEDREALLAFFDFPAEHWGYLRTSDLIESVFATVRHRTVRTKASLSQKTAKLMVFKLVLAATKTWRRLGSKPVAQARRRSQIPNGVEIIEIPVNHDPSPKFRHSSRELLAPPSPGGGQAAILRFLSML